MTPIMNASWRLQMCNQVKISWIFIMARIWIHMKRLIKVKCAKKHQKVHRKHLIKEERLMNSNSNTTKLKRQMDSSNYIRISTVWIETVQKAARRRLMWSIIRTRIISTIIRLGSMRHLSQGETDMTHWKILMYQTIILWLFVSSRIKRTYHLWKVCNRAQQ